MPGTGRPGDPLWFAIGFGGGVIFGICVHQIWAGLAMGVVVGVALALIREDAKRKKGSH